MNSIKIILFSLFISCSCQKSDQDFHVTYPDVEMEELVGPILPSDSSTLKKDTAVEITAPQVIQDAIIDSTNRNYAGMDL